mmetsp:Transcript_8159/g.28908  ORF Transcript_8159/g.28908 Transcript_8159/m.28908 type:complete len:319 (-) Transcript_8159:27-983(-)
MMTDLRAMATAHGHAIGAAQHAQLSFYQVEREDSDVSVETDSTFFVVSRHAVATQPPAWVDENGELTDVVLLEEFGVRFKQQVGVQRRTSLRRCSCQFLANSGLWCRHMYSVAHRRNMGRLPLMAVAPFWRREEREEPAAPSAPARAAQSTQARTTPTTFESRRQSLQQLVAPLIECAARTVASTAQVTRVVTGMLATFSSVAVRVEPPATQTATATALRPRPNAEDVEEGTQDGASRLAGPAHEGALVAAACPPKDSKRRKNRLVPADPSAPTGRRKRSRKPLVAEPPQKRARTRAGTAKQKPAAKAAVTKKARPAK